MKDVCVEETWTCLCVSEETSVCADVTRQGGISNKRGQVTRVNT